MKFIQVLIAIMATASALPAMAQSDLPAVDVSASNIQNFIDALPKDRISDRPIRIVDVGGYKAGVYGVFRPQNQSGRAIRHQTRVNEIYYMLEGSGVLVTGGTIADEQANGLSPNAGTPNFAGTAIENGVSRRIQPGDVVVIPGNVPHWWSSLDSDIRYLIFRADPDDLQAEK